MEKLYATIIVITIQIFMIIIVHRKKTKLKEKNIYDIINISYQIILFIFFQVILWRVF